MRKVNVLLEKVEDGLDRLVRIDNPSTVVCEFLGNLPIIYDPSLKTDLEMNGISIPVGLLFHQMFGRQKVYLNERTIESGLFKKAFKICHFEKEFKVTHKWVAALPR